ncbi:prosaposin isoform X1 [Diorhabda sublineata]|uniref:prosaposin isoform X1 n=1 Tax=Diorhabda sublineata TaxID=1163346 RepID=UPI0024E0C905|nr:prosaposin isoform X1 [Diorhabda sublineata]
MKVYAFLMLLTGLACVCGVFVPPRQVHKKQLLGSKECTWGPAYWCKNLTAAADCHAVKHCIQTDWIHRSVEPDQSSVCQICLDMVKQARDQLESNETQELIKEVFEGSCALIHIKPIVKECDKIADNYIPELVDTLASEMNPQVVCSVAGLCNNEKIKKTLEKEHFNNEESTVELDKCQGCRKVVDILEDKFNKVSRDDFLQYLLQFCGNKFGSFSDSCSNIVITYFTEIYNHLQENLNSNEVCLMSGECSSNFHSHRARVEITPNSHIGYVPVSGVKDDLPCELCEQLVEHLRDLLVANTTEDEFKQVLEGLCKQTKKFSSECVDLVDQYYPEVYSFLVNHLNSTEVCQDIGICKITDNELSSLLAPLLTPDSVQKVEEITGDKKPLIHIKVESGKTNGEALSEVNVEQPLPIDLLMPPHTQILYNKEVCAFCELFLHYVQNSITEPKTEEKIKEVIEKACNELPSTVNETCIEFVKDYEPALVAILVQEIDPSTVCPMIKVCPGSKNDVEIFMEAKGDSKCPMCLVIVTQLESVLSNNKTEEEIVKQLEKVCKMLPKSLGSECDDFVQTYTERVVEMLLSDFTPQEVCVALHLCTDSTPASDLPKFVVKQTGGNIETNVIPDNTINGHFIQNEIESNPKCLICEFVMKEIDDQLKDKHTDEDIENIVKSICDVMPGSVREECVAFVDQYADTVIQLLIAALEPSDICTYMGLCNGNKFPSIKVEILECPICEMMVKVMEKILSNPKIDHDIEHVLEKTCRGLPSKYSNECVEIVDTYGAMIIDMIVHGAGDKVCTELGYCKSLYTQVIID